MLMVLWSTRNIKSSFIFKDKAEQASCVIHEGQCPCNIRYIRETKRNSEVRLKEYKGPAGLEPAKNLKENASHKITWKVLSTTPLHYSRRKIMEAF